LILKRGMAASRFEWDAAKTTQNIDFHRFLEVVRLPSFDHS